MAAPAVQVQNWWAQVLRGIVAIVFGLIVLIWPGLALFTLKVLVVVFGIYALVDGILAILSTVRAIQQGTQWWSHLLEGAVGIIVGLLVLFWTGVTSLVLLYLIAAWAIITGIFKIVAATLSSDWLLMASGAISVVFGLVLIAARGDGALAVIQVIAVYALVFGVLQLINGYQLRTKH